MKRLQLVLICFLLIFILTGCYSEPSDYELEKVYSEELETYNGHLIDTVDVLCTSVFNEKNCDHIKLGNTWKADNFEIEYNLVNGKDAKMYLLPDYEDLKNYDPDGKVLTYKFRLSDQDISDYLIKNGNVLSYDDQNLKYYVFKKVDGKFDLCEYDLGGMYMFYSVNPPKEDGWLYDEIDVTEIYELYILVIINGNSYASVLSIE